MESNIYLKDKFDKKSLEILKDLCEFRKAKSIHDSDLFDSENISSNQMILVKKNLM